MTTTTTNNNHRHLLRSTSTTDVFAYRSSPVGGGDSFMANATGGSGIGFGSANGSGGGSGRGVGGLLSGGQTSPGHRQSLRDYEEQLNGLKRENFNLKLRIYFLETNATPGSAGGAGGVGGAGGNGAGGGAGESPDVAKEALYKQNVDLKVGFNLEMTKMR